MSRSSPKIADPVSVTLTMRGAARELGVGLTKVYELAAAGELPGAFRLGNRGRWLVHRVVFMEGLERLARGLSVDPHSPDELLRRAQDDLSHRRTARGHGVALKSKWARNGPENQ
jgi:excisionase family DNA binding protein